MIVRNIDNRIKYSQETLPTIKDTTDWDTIISNYKFTVLPDNYTVVEERYTYSSMKYYTSSETISASGYIILRKVGGMLWCYNSNPRYRYYPIINEAAGPVLQHCYIHNGGSLVIGYSSTTNTVAIWSKNTYGYMGYN